MKNLKNKDDLVNFNIFKLTVKNSLHLVCTPCTSIHYLKFDNVRSSSVTVPCFKLQCTCFADLIL